MLEDKLSDNEQFLLKRLLRSVSKASYKDLKQAIEDINKFYKLTPQETEEYLKNQMSDVFDYLKGKSIQRLKEEDEVFKKPDINKLKEAQKTTKKRLEGKCKTCSGCGMVENHLHTELYGHYKHCPDCNKY